MPVVLAFCNQCSYYALFVVIHRKLEILPLKNTFAYKLYVSFLTYRNACSKVAINIHCIRGENNNKLYYVLKCNDSQNPIINAKVDDVYHKNQFFGSLHFGSVNTSLISPSG